MKMRTEFVVKRKSPDHIGYPPHWVAEWSGERHHVACVDGVVEIDVSKVDPVEARELAAALLSAADLAERA